MTRCVPCSGPVGSRRGAVPVRRRVEPVGAPLPHVAGHVVQAESVRLEGVDGRRPGEAVGARVGSPGTSPGTRSSGARRRARARRPTGTPSRAGRRGRRTPTRLRSAASSRSTRRTPGRRSTTRGRRGGPRVRRGSDCGPSGCRQSAPSTCRHHSEPTTPRVAGKSSGRKPAKTNDHPNRSASVTWPVASTNSAKRVVLTVTASIRNGDSSTTWIGPSPSAGYARASTEPMRNVPPSRSTIVMRQSTGTCVG